MAPAKRGRFDMVDVPVPKARAGCGRCGICCERCCPRYRDPSLFWWEKAIVVLSYLQVLGLLWAMSLPWPWPARWQLWSSFSLGFSLDSFMIQFLAERQAGVGLSAGSAARYISPWGEPRYAWIHAVPWMVLVPAMGAVACFRRQLAKLCCPSDVRCGRAWMLDAGLASSVALSLPAQLALLRVYTCESNPDFGGSLRWAPDPSWACFSSDAADHRHTILAAVAAPATLIAVLAPTLALCATAAAAVPRQAASAAHERFLRWREAEYEHGIGFAWRRHGLWAVVSFVGPRGAATALCGDCDGGPGASGRGGGACGTLSCGGRACPTLWLLTPAFTRAHWAATTTAMVLVYTFLRISTLAQTTAVTGLLLAWAARQSLRPAFRVASTNRLWGIALWGMTWNALLCVLRASGYSAEFTVDSFYSLGIAASNALVLLLAAVTCCAAAVAQRRRGEGPCPYPGARRGGLRLWAGVAVPPGTAEAWPRGTILPPTGRHEDDEGAEALSSTHILPSDAMGRALVGASQRSGLWFRSGPRGAAGRHDDAADPSGPISGMEGGSLAPVVLREGAAAPASRQRRPGGAGGPGTPRLMGGSASLMATGGDDDFAAGLEEVAEEDEEESDSDSDGVDVTAAGTQGPAASGAAVSAAVPAVPGWVAVSQPAASSDAAAQSERETDQLIATARRRAGRDLALAAAAGSDAGHAALYKPGRPDEPRAVARLERRWIRLLRMGRAALRRARHAPSLIVDVAAVSAVADAAHAELVEASASRHVLALSLRELVEEAAVVADAAARGSMLPWPKGEADLEAARFRLAARPLDLSLASRRSRIILLRLLALGAIVGRRRLRTLRWRPRPDERRPPSGAAAAAATLGLATPGAAAAAAAGGRGRSFRAAASDAEAGAIDPAALAPDDVRAMAPGRLLHVTAAAVRRWDVGVSASQAPAVRAVLEACRERWATLIGEAEAQDADPSARRRRLAWYEAWEHSNAALGRRARTTA